MLQNIEKDLYDQYKFDLVINPGTFNNDFISQHLPGYKSDKEYFDKFRKEVTDGDLRKKKINNLKIIKTRSEYEEFKDNILGDEKAFNKGINLICDSNSREWSGGGSNDSELDE